MPLFYFGAHVSDTSGVRLQEMTNKYDDGIISFEILVYMSDCVDKTTECVEQLSIYQGVYSN